MRAMLKELKRSIFSFRMLIALVIGIMLLLQPEVYIHQMGTSLMQMDLANAMMTSLGLGAYIIIATIIM